MRVSTLHSLALRLLRAAGLLHYPADPLVLDNWELESIFDAEFGISHGVGKKRREEIRREHEAFWSTGQWNPPNYIPAVPPITPAERAAFNAHHGPRTQAYSCVLPGEIVRQCQEQIVAGNLDPVGLIHLGHLIVDEYQDLNPVDQQFIHEFIVRGSVTFIAGDDDQSIYSFRYGSPNGIQTFTQRYATATSHTLSDCFRCTQNITVAANALMLAHPSPTRIPKTLTSLYAGAVPVVAGTMARWRFASAQAEAQALAASCVALINAGLNPRYILILLSNQRELLPPVREALNELNVAFEPPRSETFIDSATGRFVLGLTRVVCDPNDYVAHRLLLGLRSGVGTGTCDSVAASVIDHALNFREIFYNQIPAGVFTARALSAINHVRQVCAGISTWQRDDTITHRIPDIANFLSCAFNPVEAQNWLTYAAALPADMTLGELRNYLWADTDEQQAAILGDVFERLNQPIPVAAALPARVRVMSMHGAKGLSAHVVFVPGLEEQLFPGPWRQPYPGLVLEAARLLYVSVTRARAACIVSYSRSRMMQGRTLATVPSRYTTALGGPFVFRNAGLQAHEIQDIMTDIGNLF